MTASDWSRSIDEARREARFWRWTAFVEALVIALFLVVAYAARWQQVPCADYQEMRKEVQLGR